MKTEYFAMPLVGNLKTDDDKVRWYIEPMDGGGVTHVANSEEEAKAWVENVGGVYVEV